MEPAFLAKRLVLVGVFFLLAPIALATSLYSLSIISTSSAKTVKTNSLANPVNTLTNSGAKIYASLPSQAPWINAEVEVGDARPEIIKAYLKRFDSPITQYAPLIVKTADKYGLDYRLITAIAQQESNLCKRIPDGSYNCWGWGIHSRGTLFFDSFADGIETVSAGLKKNYIDEGLTVPELIMTKYTPSSPEGAWAKGVSSFMEDMMP